MPEDAESWVKLRQLSGRDALASGTTSTGPPLNTEQAHAVNIVRQHDLQLQAYRLQRDRRGEELLYLVKPSSLPSRFV